MIAVLQLGYWLNKQAMPFEEGRGMICSDEHGTLYLKNARQQILFVFAFLAIQQKEF